MLQNAEEAITSPTTESPKDEEKAATEAVENIAPAASEETTTTVETASEVKIEEPAKTTDEPKPEEPKPAPVAEPKVSEPVCEKPAESAPSPVKEDVPQVETPKVVEDSNTAESKEVRSDDVPPPLPSSNPPSPVTVFAESTKADALNVQEIPLLQSPAASADLILEPTTAKSSSETEIVNESASETKHGNDKLESGDVKSESISKSEKTDNELKTVEQKTIDIVSESSDAIMSDNSDAKNLSETLNNVSSIDTSETVVASSEPQIKSEDTSSEAPISSETVPESGQPPIEDIPIDIPNTLNVQTESTIEKAVPELAQEQPSITNVATKVETEPSQEQQKTVETRSEPIRESPEAMKVVPEVVNEASEATKESPEPIKDASEALKETAEPIKEIETNIETVESKASLPEPPKESTESSCIVLEPTDILPPPPKEVSDVTPEQIIETSASKENLPQSPQDIVTSPIKDTDSSITVESLPEKLDIPAVSENSIVSPEPLPEPPKTDILSSETVESNQTEHPPTSENSPVATQSSETLPASPPPSPATIPDAPKAQPEASLPEPAVPSPELEPPVINAADSLPDISTESLPSLPEPFSENLAEPMSLPPVESVPEPIAIDSPTSDPPLVTECPAPILSNNSVVLTNGNTNGLPSPVTEEVSSAPPKMTEGPLKQVNSANENKTSPLDLK